MNRHSRGGGEGPAAAAGLVHVGDRAPQRAHLRSERRRQELAVSSGESRARARRRLDGRRTLAGHDVGRRLSIDESKGLTKARPQKPLLAPARVPSGHRTRPNAEKEGELSLLRRNCATTRPVSEQRSRPACRWSRPRINIRRGVLQRGLHETRCLLRRRTAVYAPRPLMRGDGPTSNTRSAFPPPTERIQG